MGSIRASNSPRGADHADVPRNGTVTAAKFPADARDFSKTVPFRIVLIDDEALSCPLVRYGVAVRGGRRVIIKKRGEGYFSGA
jgi:restriction endonuclease Mrr